MKYDGLKKPFMISGPWIPKLNTRVRSQTKGKLDDIRLQVDPDENLSALTGT